MRTCSRTVGSLLLALGLLLAGSPCAQAQTYARITSAIGSPPSFVSDATTAARDTTGADLILLFVAQLNAVSAPTDNKSNTWTQLTTYGGTVSGRWYYCHNPTVGAGHTFTEPYNGNGAAQIGMMAYSGSAASPFDVENGNATSSGTSLSTGSVTPSHGNELIVTALSYNTAQVSPPPSVDVGSIVTSAQPVGGTNFGMVLAEEIQTSAITRNATWSDDTAGFMTAAIAAFTASGGGGGGSSGVETNCLLLGVCQ